MNDSQIEQGEREGGLNQLSQMGAASCLSKLPCSCVQHERLRAQRKRKRKSDMVVLAESG